MVFFNKSNNEQRIVETDTLEYETPEVESILDLFQQQVALNPSRKAIIFDDMRLTYKEVDQLSNRMANCLIKEYNIGPQDTIGLRLERSEWAIISMLAIIKTGASYVPIDLSSPHERIKYILRDSKCGLVIDGKQVKRFQQVKHEYSSLSPHKKPKLEDRAYIIYTSGSTGKPKGVPITNANLLNYLNWAERFYKGDKEQFNFPFFTSFSFDLTQTSILLTLISGGVLHVFSSNDVNKNLKSILNNKSINAVKLTPSHIQIMPIEEKTENLTFIIGGETLLPTHVKKIKSINPKAEIFNEYGPTEATIGCTCFRIDNENIENQISIGKPIDNTKIYILGNDDELLPEGEAGELCISGKGLTKEYLNRPDLTKEKFIQHPLLSKDEGLIYKTGDLAKLLPDGNLEYLGRIDDQVKIRGHRIELGEIMSLIGDSGMVKQNIVLTKEDHQSNQVLIAFVVFAEHYNKFHLKEYMELFLPNYMIPSLLIGIDELPLTSNGKIDKKKLLSLDLNTLIERSHDLPRNKMEEQILDLWSDILGIEDFGIHDNFFDLGGHSLLGINLIAKVSKEYSLNLGIEFLFDYPDVSSFSEALEAVENEEKKSKNINVLTKFNKGLKKPQLFCVSGVSGRNNSYFELGNTYGKDYELYVFRSVGLFGEVPALKEVEEMAELYIQELQEINPTGPYTLAGYSFGGRIVFEMAQQLKQKGLEVKKIVLFDTWIFDHMPKDVFAHLKTDEDWLWHWTHDFVRRYDKKISLSVEELHGKTKKEQYEFIHTKLCDLDIITDEKLMRGGAEVFINNLKCKYSEIDKPKLNVPILVLSTDSANDYGWSKVTTANVEVIDVPGNHRSVLRKPHVQSLTVKLKKALQLT